MEKHFLSKHVKYHSHRRNNKSADRKRHFGKIVETRPELFIPQNKANNQVERCENLAGVSGYKIEYK